MKLQNSLRREASICFILRFRHLPKGAESASCQWNKYIQQLIQTDDETISWSLEFRSFCGKSQIQKVNLGPNSSRGMPWPFQSPRNLPEVHLNLCTLRRSLVVASMGTKNSGSTFFAWNNQDVWSVKHSKTNPKTTPQTRTSPSVLRTRWVGSVCFLPTKKCAKETSG